ncbi:methyl-accepting chemotaxis protein [Tunturiibacter lichenicola]|uniref:methyl-accepting chemotaxis protein n=1 Tax=Tunturiibacter lichenicola TaxID=2051959 RepID=UPI0021B46948|nr:methyl-accepting chemotaxis protein [Edaphobacter lichenicola]
MRLLELLHSSDQDAQLLEPIYRVGDRFMVWTIEALGLLCLVFAFFGSTGFAVVLIDGLLAAAAWLFYRRYGGTLRLRVINAVLLMSYSALMIQEFHGLIETHFGIFALLAFLVCYRDWRPLVAGAATIATHHLLFFQLHKMNLPFFAFPCGHGFGMVLVHALYVVIETVVLVYLAMVSREEAIRMAHDLNAERGRLEQIERVAQTIDQAASELTAVAEESERLAQEQLTEVQKVAYAFEAVSAGNEDIARRTESAKTKTRIALEQIEESNMVLSETMERIQGISVGIMAATTEVEKLETQMGSIAEILKLIRSIASNTHMLSLNASIEASRAGAAGRGFNVVAAEIRGLAQSSEQSTSRIETMVKGLMEQAAHARREITTNSTTALAELEHLEAIRKRLRRLTECSMEIRESTQEIAHSANSQCAETNKVTKPLGVLGDSVQRGAAHTRRLIGTIMSLNGLIGQST